MVLLTTTGSYRDACLCRNFRLINILKVELMCFFTSLLDSFH